MCKDGALEKEKEGHFHERISVGGDFSRLFLFTSHTYFARDHSFEMLEEEEIKEMKKKKKKRAGASDGTRQQRTTTTLFYAENYPCENIFTTH